MDKIVALAILFALAVLALTYSQKGAQISEKEQACINAGGTVRTSLCCKATDDFPNLCLVGPCGCSPENSHEVKICECPEGKCFDGNRCV